MTHKRFRHSERALATEESPLRSCLTLVEMTTLARQDATRIL